MSVRRMCYKDTNSLSTLDETHPNMYTTESHFHFHVGGRGGGAHNLGYTHCAIGYAVLPTIAALFARFCAIADAFTKTKIQRVVKILKSQTISKPHTNGHGNNRKNFVLHQKKDKSHVQIQQSVSLTQTYTSLDHNRVVLCSLAQMTDRKDSKDGNTNVLSKSKTKKSRKSGRARKTQRWRRKRDGYNNSNASSKSTTQGGSVAGGGGAGMMLSDETESTAAATTITCGVCNTTLPAGVRFGPHARRARHVKCTRATCSRWLLNAAALRSHLETTVKCYVCQAEFCSGGVANQHRLKEHPHHTKCMMPGCSTWILPGDQRDHLEDMHACRECKKYVPNLEEHKEEKHAEEENERERMLALGDADGESDDNSDENPRVKKPKDDITWITIKCEEHVDEYVRLDECRQCRRVPVQSRQ